MFTQTGEVGDKRNEKTNQMRPCTASGLLDHQESSQGLEVSYNVGSKVDHSCPKRYTDTEGTRGLSEQG